MWVRMYACHLAGGGGGLNATLNQKNHREQDYAIQTNAIRRNGMGYVSKKIN